MSLLLCQKLANLRKKKKIYNLFYKESIEIKSLVNYLELLLKKKAFFKIINKRDIFYKNLKNIKNGKNIIINRKYYYKKIFKKYI